MLSKLCKCAMYSLVTILPLVLTYYLRKKTKICDSQNIVYDFVFITEKNRDCTKHVYLKKICGENCSSWYLKKIINFFASAKRSISVCMYLLTLREIAQILIDCHNAGINVRLITDFEMIACGNIAINNIKQSGIVIKTQNNSRNYLHHKIAIVDANEDTAKALFGSLNFSLQALVKNYENFVITNNQMIVNKFNTEFEYLWQHLTEF